MNPYPEGLILTVEDFTGCGWKEALSHIKRTNYMAMHGALSAAEKKAREEDRQEHGKALWLLAESCHMMLVPDNPNEPYQSIWSTHKERSIIPEDFSETDVEFLADIVSSIDDPMLKARIADLVWTVDRSRGVHFPLMAIDSYTSIPFEEDTWRRDIVDCWERAVVLAKLLRGGAGDRLETMVKKLVRIILEEGSGVSSWLANVLKSNGIGGGQSQEISKRMEYFGTQFEEEKNDFHEACDFFQAAIDWTSEDEDKERAIELTVRLAECWVKNAEYQSQQAVASAFYETAIRAYRKVPREYREVYEVDNRIAQLRERHNESNRISLDQMGVVTTPPIDITQIVRNAREEVKGRELLDAIDKFVNLTGWNVQELREDAIRQIREFPLQAIMPFAMTNREGHTVGSRPGINLQESEESEANAAVVEAKMIEHFGLQMGLSVNGSILPALEVMNLEHRMRQIDFLAIAKRCLIVPEGRELHFAKGLLAGYNHDFGAAMYVLSPQIENMVRRIFADRGVQTTTIADGIQHEVGLSALVDKPEALEILGEDLLFPIKALFCDNFGPNVRNNTAHGLYDDDAYYSAPAVYTWYFAFKIVFNGFLSLHQRPNRESDNDSAETPESR